MGVDGEPDNLKPEWVAPGVVFLASGQCQDTGYILRASNGQFTATRFVENPGVDYPVELARVSASSAEQVAQQWERIKESHQIDVWPFVAITMIKNTKIMTLP